MATMQQTAGVAGRDDDGVPITHVIAAYKGLSLEEAAAWWEQKVAEAPARRAAMLRTLPRWDRHQVIRLGGEAAMVVPMATYRRLRELEQRVSPRAAELIGVVEAPTVGEWRAAQEDQADADGPEQRERGRDELEDDAPGSVADVLPSPLLPPTGSAAPEVGEQGLGLSVAV